MPAARIAPVLVAVLTAIWGTLLENSNTWAAPADEAVVRRNAAAPLVERAVQFLSQHQADNGAFSPELGTGITSLVATALLRHGHSADDPTVNRALEFLQGFVHEDGGIYQPGSIHRNYETCLAVVAFHLANTDQRYDNLIADAERFIKESQWDHGESIDEKHMSFGGSGYGSHSRPDLSNTAFLIDTLHTLGRGDNDPAIQRALIFVSRCQNLDTPHNDSPHADKNPDGGFYYTVAAGGSSQAGTDENGALRSYGSMTYAGLKSMIFAGVTADDQRVQAAYQWAKKHYTLQENPGLADNGLYYYYHTVAKSLDAVGQPLLVDSAGRSHDWRAEFITELAARQQPDGSWVNSNQRWLENDPNLVTAYALLALAYCL